ncbi:hypothetical protein Tco_0900099 [Tanacetum coccineum]
MANAEHAPAMVPPVRTDEQILPRIRWVPIGKSNCYLNEEKSQPSPIFKIAVDILKQTNFFRAFTASSIIPAIYIQQFWDTICFDSKAGSYKCQLDEQWFDLTQDTLRDALQITPVNKNRAFSPPRSPDYDYRVCQELGYQENLNLKRIQEFKRQVPSVQILWGVINRALLFMLERRFVAKVCYSVLIHNFTEDKRNLAQQAKERRKRLSFLILGVMLLLTPALKHRGGDTCKRFLEERPNRFDALPYSMGLSSKWIQGENVLGNFNHCKRKWCRERGWPYVESYSLYAEIGLYGNVTWMSDEECLQVVRSGAQDEVPCWSCPWSVTIQQDTSVIPPMTSPVIGPVPRPDSPNVHWPLPTPTTQLQQQQQQLFHYHLNHNKEIDRKINESVKEVVISSVKHAMRAPLRARFKDLPTSDMKEILLQCMLEENYDKGHATSRVAYESTTGLPSVVDESKDFVVDTALEELRRKTKQDSPKTPPGSPPSPPPPPLPPLGTSGASGTSEASDSAQAPPLPPPSSSTHQGSQLEAELVKNLSLKTDCNLLNRLGSIPSSDWDYATNNCSLLLSKLTYALTVRTLFLAKPGCVWRNLWIKYCKRTRNHLMHLKNLVVAHSFEIVKVCFHSCRDSSPIPNGKGVFRPQIFTDQVDDTILRYNISKPLPLGGEPGHVTIQPDFFFKKTGVSRLCRKVGRRHVNLEDDCKSNIFPGCRLGSKLVPDQTTNSTLTDSHHEGDVRAVRPHLRILCVVCIEVFSMYGQLHEEKFSTSSTDLKEYVIAKWELQVTLPFSVMALCNRNVNRLLDYRVKEFRINRTNPGMNARFWTKKDVDRSKDFIVSLSRTAYRQDVTPILESFVWDGIREGRLTGIMKRTE